MENQNTNQSLFDLSINENTKTQLRGAAVWAGIAAILSLVSAIIGLARSIIERNNPAKEYRFEGFNNQATVSTQSTGNVVSTVISLIITILLFYFLNRFSGQTKSGLISNNQELVNNGLGSLSSYFVTIGIILIIGLAFLVLALAIGLSAPGGGYR